MLMMLIFFQVRIFKILMRIFKALRRMVKKFTQVGILKEVKMIMSMVDTMLMMIFLPLRIFKVSMTMIGKFSPSENLNGIDSLMGDDDFPSSEYFHGRSNDIGEDGNHVSIDFYIPLMYDIIN
jgi:hypothetical protein